MNATPSSRRTGRGVLLAPLVLVSLLLGGCATPHSLTDPPPDGVPTPSSTVSFGDVSGDFLVVRAGDTEVRLANITGPADDPEQSKGIPVIVGDDVFVFVRAAGWPLYAEQFTGIPWECGERSYAPEVENLGRGWWRVNLIGPAARYSLHLSAGSGPGLPIGGETGSLEAIVAVETVSDRAVPPPFASLDFQFFEGGESTLILDLSYLTDTPAHASASVVITGDGPPLEMELTLDEWACPPSGAVMFLDRLSEDVVAALGDGELHFDVTVVLDGVSHRASSVLAERQYPMQMLFTPALP